VHRNARYRANSSDLFFKARCELPPGTILYANLIAFIEFIMWTPEAQRNGEDPSWSGPFPASEPGVYIFEARSVSTDLSAPACLLPEANSLSMDLAASGNSAAGRWSQVDGLGSMVAGRGSVVRAPHYRRAERLLRRRSSGVARLPCPQRHSDHYRFRCVAPCRSTRFVRDR
jgi:hypothetical protein